MAANRIFVRVFAVVAFFCILAGDALRYSITWFGWGAVALILLGVSIALLAQSRDRWHLTRLPYPMLAFILLTFLSIAWSDYRIWTLAGAVTTLVTITIAMALAVVLSKDDLLFTLGTALRFVLGLSLLFELVVSLFVRRPILPWWENFGSLTIHNADYWSRDLLFTGQRIQGIMGNSNLLGFAALLGLIVFAVQLAGRTVRVVWGVLWIAVAVLCLALTRSGTVTIALAAVAIVAVIILAVRWARPGIPRAAVYLVSLAAIAAGIIGTIAFHSQVLALLGKSSTLTGRTGIWAGVITLAKERPVFGWGWLSYWVPWVKPFKDNPAFVNGGVQYLQAHEAWLDVWFQLGIVGLVVFGLLVVTTATRLWILAIDRHTITRSLRGRYGAVTILPALIMVALLAQSLAESRLLLEYGMLFLTMFAMRSKRDLLGPTVS